MQGLIETARPAADAAQSSPEQQLRSLFYGNDSSVFKRDGEALLAASKGTLESRAWFLAQAHSAAGDPFFAALSHLDSMQREAPHDPWTLAARTFFESDVEQAIWLAEKAIAKDSREDILLLCARGMIGQVETEDDRKLFTAFLDRHREKFEVSAQGLAVLADSIRNLRPVKEQRSPSDAAAALYDRALQMEPANVMAVSGKVKDLAARKQHKEAAELIEQSGALLLSEQLQIEYFYFVVPNLADLDDGGKANAIESAGRGMLESREPSEDYVDRLFDKLVKLSEPRAQAIVDLIVQRYPKLKASEYAVLKGLIGGFDVQEATPENKKEMAVKLIEFLTRPNPRGPETENEAIRILDRIADCLSTEQVVQVFRLVPPEQALTFIQRLADRKANLPELERVASEHVERLVNEAKVNSLVWRHGLPKMKAFSLKGFWLGFAAWQDVLGLIYLQLGRLEDAELRLTATEKLLDMDCSPWGPGRFVDGREGLMPRVHLAQLCIAKSDYTKAEEYLSRAMSVEWFTEHPAIAVYKECYLRKHGSAEGLDAYMASVGESERDRRKSATLKERIADAQPIPPFKLKTLDGETVSSDELKGKVVVINFWGVWCGYCVQEMPEFQQFVEKYKGNSRIAVLTIDANDTPEKIKAFMAKKNYNFPVLLEGDYLTKAKVGGFPTTWFLDIDGRKAFEKLGATKELLEEFTWRVEELIPDANV
ncbi:MAG: redoxin domain-containing protein [Terriglobales bacterium]